MTNQKNLKFLYHEPLNMHTAFKIGGPARVWAEPQDINELKDILYGADKEGLIYRVIGNGSNILVSDTGVSWIVIKMTNFTELAQDKDSIIAGSGVRASTLVGFSMEKGLTGLEFLAGIPGTVGGIIKMNAGAFGSDVAGVLEEAEIMGKDGRARKLLRDEIAFGYRYSDITNDMIITKARFRLKPFSHDGIVGAVSDILRRRRDKFPSEFPNAGSIFRNQRDTTSGEIIERAGLKGTVRGRAMVSKKHANIIVNLGGARAEDVKELINHIKKKVLEETGINLELEIEMW